MKKRAGLFGLGIAISLAVFGCKSQDSRITPAVITSSPAPAMMAPISDDDVIDASAVTESAEVVAIDLSESDAVVWRETDVEFIDTTIFDPQISMDEPGSKPLRRMKEILPSHTRHVVRDVGPANDLPLGGVIDHPRTQADSLWPAIGQSGWIPPDPTLAVGPTHIVTTVNQSIAFYTRDGVREFLVELNHNGNPGFFEPLGARGFTFDPKCFYDHYAQRFVVIAPEVYTDTEEAWICIAVSDDSNPNGIWYKYRTDAVIASGDLTFWWDYPGFGYDQDAYYMTGNLYGLNGDGWGGAGFRIFDKSTMLSGGTVQYATLRDGSAASVQVAQHFGDNLTPYFVSVQNNSQLRIHAIRNPLTSPQIVSTTVSVPSFSSPFDAPASGSNTVHLIDARVMNAHWRDGNLYAAHQISQGSRNFARWYHLQTNNWPTSGNVTFVQSGNIDAGGDLHSWFPAIYSSQAGNVAAVFGTCSATQRIALGVTGRLVNDPPGAMGAVEVLKQATRDGGGRWGDYYDIAVDPLDDTTFWVIGQYPESYGWQTWIGNFSISAEPLPHAMPDDVGGLFQGEAVKIDVLANDYHSGGLDFFISDFDATTISGGAVTLSAGTGPDGRDELIYTAPENYAGADSFSYTISDDAQHTSSATIFVNIFDPSDFRDPVGSVIVEPGITAKYYELSAPSVLPDFSTLAPYAESVVSTLNYASSAGNFADSGLSDEVGAVYEGYLNISRLDLYTLYLSSDDGSRLYLGDELLIDNDGLHGMTELSATVGLKPGRYRIRVEFFENGGSAGLIVSISAAQLAKQAIPAERWLRPADCPGDVNGGGSVDLVDLAILLARYGRTSGQQYYNGDLDGDGDIDLFDLAALLSVYGTDCE